MANVVQFFDAKVTKPCPMCGQGDWRVPSAGQTLSAQEPILADMVRYTRQGSPGPADSGRGLLRHLQPLRVHTNACQNRCRPGESVKMGNVVEFRNKAYDSLPNGAASGGCIGLGRWRQGVTWKRGLRGWKKR